MYPIDEPFRMPTSTERHLLGRLLSAEFWDRKNFGNSLTVREFVQWTTTVVLNFLSREVARP